MEDEMRERPGDDTTDAPAGSRAEPDGKPGNYYYDDGTGYEVYKPEDEESAETIVDDEDASGA